MEKRLMASFFSSFRAVPALAAAVVLGLLLADGVVSAPAPPVPKGDAGDLALVPADAQGLITLRIADLYKLDIVRKGLAALEKQSGAKTDFVAELRKATGLAPADVERFTSVIVDAKADVSYAIVSTTKPYDRARLLDKLGGAKTVKHGGRTYHVGKIASAPSDVAMYFVNPRVIVYAPRAG